MSYCLNPHCQKPQNQKNAQVCLSCNTQLLLKQRYRAIKPIGQGGFGRTLLAVDEDKPSKPACVIRQLQIVKHPNIDVAQSHRTPLYLSFLQNICIKLRHFVSWISNFLKQFLPKTQRTNNAQKATELFKQEALKLDDLGKHNQIPELLAYLTQEEHQYLIQEYIDGHNLVQILAKQGAFKEQQIWKLLNSLLPVLEFIHSHDVIHGNIKPQNIISSRNGKIYLVDFGAAKIVTETAIQTGISISIPELIVLEQNKGKAIYTGDLYCLGVTCIYLLTGVDPFYLFDFSKNAWVWRQSLVDNPVSNELNNILDKLIENTISLRYQSASEVLQDINYHKKNTFKNIEKISDTTPEKVNSPIVTSQKKQKVSDTTPEKVNSLIVTSQKKQKVSDTTPEKVNSPIVTSQKKQKVSDTTPEKVNSPIVTSQKKQKVSDTTPEKVNSPIVTSQKKQKVSDTTPEKVNSPIVTSQKKQKVSDTTPEKVNSLIVKPLNYSSWRYIDNFTGHNGSIDSVAISPDGNILASGSHDSTIKLWEINTGKLLRTIKNENIVYTILFSPDGSIIASSGFDNKIKLWDVNSDNKICTLKGHIGWFTSVNSLSFSPDNQTLASAGSDKILKLWDLKTGSEIRNFTAHDTWVGSVAISPDGQIIASGSGDKTAMLWDLNTGRILNILNHTGMFAAVRSVAFSPDGQIIATASEDSTIKLWKVNTGQEICTINGHSAGLRCVTFNPNKDIFASSSDDNDIKLWDINTKQEICTLKAHSAKVNSLVFSPDGQTLYSSSDDKTIKVWRCQ